MPRFLTDSQRIADRVGDAILAGELKPGERLPQRQLAADYGTTTIVVREALRLLEIDGLVEIQPKWGAIVAEIDAERLHGRYVVREALEGMAARLASQAYGNADREELEQLAARCDRDLPADGMSAHEKANLHYALHARIVRVTDCEPLISLIERTNLQSIILSNAYHIDWSQEREAWHSRLIKAIVSRDPEEAERAMREHVRRGYEMERRALPEHDETRASSLQRPSAEQPAPRPRRRSR